MLRCLSRWLLWAVEGQRRQWTRHVGALGPANATPHQWHEAAVHAVDARLMLSFSRATLLCSAGRLTARGRGLEGDKNWHVTRCSTLLGAGRKLEKLTLLAWLKQLLAAVKKLQAWWCTTLAAIPHPHACVGCGRQYRQYITLCKLFRQLLDVA